MAPADEIQAVVGSHTASAFLNVSVDSPGEVLWPTHPDQVGVVGAGLSYDDLTPSGTISVSADGQVIEGLDITGTILSKNYNNVTVRNCRIRFSGPNAYGIKIGWQPTGWLVEDCEFEHTGTDADAASSDGISAGGVIVRRCEFHGIGNGIKAVTDDLIMEDNLTWNMRRVPGTHSNSLEFRGGNNCQVRRNYLMGGASACVAFYADNNSQHNVVVEDNYLTNIIPPWGGVEGYASYLLNFGGKSEAPNNSDWVVNRNVTARNAEFPEGGQYGPYQNYGDFETWANVQRCDNVWEDDGSLAVRNFGC